MLNGIVYKLKCNDPNIKEFYIGSSVNIKKRIISHKTKCNNITSIGYNFKVYEFIRNNGNFDNFEFEILLEIEVKSKKELKNKYEAKYIIDFKPELNTKIPTTYDDENVEYEEEFFKPSYYEEHKEIILEKGNQYYKDHKEEISKKRKEKYTCDCGSTIRKYDKTTHMKSKKHQDYIKSLETNSNEEE